MRLYYNPKLKELAWKLRKNSTLSEVLLWQYLRNRQMQGFDFHRQNPIDEFIVDFFCPRLKLIIEIDGVTHNERLAKDERRQKKLERMGFTFLRFLDSDVKENLEGVLSAIEEWIKEHKT
jgi:very-short-patch-repair endonuclease